MKRAAMREGIKAVSVTGKRENVHKNDESKKRNDKSFQSSAPRYFKNNFRSSMSDQRDNWYCKVLEEPSEFPVCPSETVQQLYVEAEKLLASETAAHEAKSNKNSEKRWMRSVMTKGTIRDRLASYTLMIQDAPLYNLKALESLIGLVKPAKKESVSCISVLVELFVSNLLKPESKLKLFANHPLVLLDDLCSGNPSLRRRRLISWYFEDKLKSLYRDFIESLQRMVKDSVDSSKENAIGALGKLLRSNSEQEAVLLSYLVNKLGDPNKRVASKAMHCLVQTLQHHPNMKGVIMDEVEKLLFRQHIGQKARYYGICFLTQIMFSRSDSQLAAKLIKIYFSFFRACVKQGNVDSRMLKLLLSGVNRAYPYAREAMDTISEQLETLYKVVHLAPLHIALQALNLLFQVADYKNSVSDRFYSVFYRVLLSPSLPQTPHFAIFLNLFYRAVKKDESSSRVRAFIKRILQVCCFMSAPLMCATLFTLSHLMRSRRFVASVFVQESKDSGEAKSIMKDTSSSQLIDDESGDEHYEDVKLEEDTNMSQDYSKSKKESVLTPWNHRKNLELQSKRHGDCSTEYDPMQRNPLFAHGELCCYTELCLLALHYHPTVALFASQIMKGEWISYSGDPLKDFTLTRFLERFTFKNPKKQPELSQSSVFAKRQKYVSRGLKAVALNSKGYINQHEEKIPVDERFLFRFLQQRRQRTGKDEDDDLESVGSDEFDDVIDDLMAKKGLKADVDKKLESEDLDVDFADEYGKNASSKRKLKKKDAEDGDVSFSDDSEADDLADLEDEEEQWEDLSDIEDDDNSDGHENVDQSQKRKRQGGRHEALHDVTHKLKKGKWEDETELHDIEDDIEGLSDFDDMEAIEFGAESDDEVESFSSKKRKAKNDWESKVFVPTEEFAELLEAAGKANQGRSSDLSNKDKAGAKQLAWEMNRDHWIKGNSRSGKRSSNPKKGDKFRSKAAIKSSGRKTAPSKRSRR